MGGGIRFNSAALYVNFGGVPPVSLRWGRGDENFFLAATGHLSLSRFQSRLRSEKSHGEGITQEGRGSNGRTQPQAQTLDGREPAGVGCGLLCRGVSHGEIT